MKSQDKAKLHQSTIAELQTKLHKLTHQLVTTSQLIRLGKETNLKAAHNLKKDITIIKTIIHQKELESPSQEQTHETA